MTSPTPPGRARARDLGIQPGRLPTGRLNAITDIPGVLVGQRTLIEGDDVRTGVTAVLPHGGNLYQHKVAGAVHVGNGFGKTAGSIQVGELGTIETPIVLTNTLSVAAGIGGVITWTLAQPGNEQVSSINALVGETNDSGLNDIRGRHVTEADVVAAIEAAISGPVEEGAVGAGTGTSAFGWKGGIGTSSRLVGDRVVGVLVQTNYGGVLRIDGVPIAPELTPDTPGADSADGSCMIIIGTDASIAARSLERIAARAVFALARTGSSYSHGSGDIAVAFSTADTAAPAEVAVGGSALSPLFEATLDATEEAVYNSLFAATTVTGFQATRRPAIPLDAVRKILARRSGPGMHRAP
ncbi:D-aminopeptidase [Microlunatus endophyticus]|uniref:D-aminopeptidase n=1 Tax=Microlunatus endophyticus TaxID=1716077 RepID=A0A917S478_9ACTN|nr:P1 family peptidase [Microlunatus endophyticus]GGL56574.1 D-aminopeptidase [Microlunatus endophyticus]